MKAVKRSFTLDEGLLQRVEARSEGNLSQTVSHLLSEALDREEELQRIRELAEAMGTEIDPEIEARAMRYLLGVIETGRGSARASA